jgi:uncharacterized protein involved in outer membrane biogenesis
MEDKRQKRRVLRIGLLVAVGVLVLLPVVGILYLKLADLSGQVPRVERLVSEAIGREFRIEGEFEPEIGWTTTLCAGKVSLFCPDCSSEPEMLYADRLEVSVDLWSILFGPVRLHDIRAEGVRVRVDLVENCRRNWLFPIRNGNKQRKKVPSHLGVTFDKIEARDVNVVVDNISQKRPSVVVQADHLNAHLVDAETLDVELSGQFAERSLELAGQISSVDRLIQAGPVKHDLTGRLGKTRVAFRGSLVELKSLKGPDLELEMDGPEIQDLTESLALPSMDHGPYHLIARTSPTGAHVDFELRVKSERLEADARGRVESLTKPGKFDVSLAASGTDLALIRPFVDLPGQVNGGFSVSGRMEGTREEFTVQGLRMDFGDSNLAGTIRVELGDKPFLHADLMSDRLVLADLLGTETGEANAEPTTEAKPKKRTESPKEKSSGKKKGLFFSDKRFDTEMLGRMNLDLDLSVTRNASHESGLTDVEIGLNILDGKLTVDPFKGSGEREGTVNGSLSFVPVPGGYELQARLRVENSRLSFLSYGTDHTLWPKADVDLKLLGSGNSPHAVASSLEGWATLWIGEGQIANNVLGLITADVLFTILETLNPFVRKEPYSLVECGVTHVEFKTGIARVDPLVLRGEKMTIVGSGQVKFSNEELDLRWVAKPRKGIGLSASTLTNTYIKQGGTLSNPSLEIKPIEAVVSTGAAVATLGLSILARGLWDRATAELDVCDSGLKQIRKIEAERERKRVESRTD